MGLFRHYWVLTSLGLTLLATIVLLQHMPTEGVNVYKPRGMTAYGRRVSHRVVSSPSRQDTRSGFGSATAAGTPRWVHAIWIHAVALVLLFALMHLATGGLQQH